MTHSTGNSERKRNKKKPIAIGLGVLVVVVLAFAAWLGFSAYSAKNSLDATRTAAQDARTALLAGNVDAASTSAAAASSNAANASAKTTSIPWKIAAAVPYLGDPLDVAGEVTAVVRGLADDVLVPAVQAGSALSPRNLVNGAGNVDLQPLRDAEPVLEQTSAAAAALDDRAEAIPESPFLAVINDARTQLQDQTHDLSTLLRNTYTASRLLPSMMGADGPRNYFLAFQTNAEARGTGGLLGGFGILNADNGNVKIQELASNQDLDMGRAPIDLGADYEKLWGSRNTTTDFRNSNASPNFPYAGKIWSTLWEQQTGQQLDGTIATDPIALSYILGATGPVTLPGGEVISADNVVETTLSTSYARFADDNAGRKAYLQDIAAAVVGRMTATVSADPQKLAEALGRAASEGRLSVWSADESEQQIIGDTKVGHVLPETTAPYAGVVIDNAGGNKMDYYLERKISYTAETCTGDTRKSTVTAALTNNVDATGLTPYVASTFRTDVPYGTNESIVYLYATQGAKIGKVTVNGNLAFTVQSGVEKGHPVTAVYVTTPPGDTQTVSWEVVEPSTSGEAIVAVQPLVDTPDITVDVPTC